MNNSENVTWHEQGTSEVEKTIYRSLAQVQSTIKHYQ